MPNVVGVGIGYKKSAGKTLDELSLVTMVRTKVPESNLPAKSIIPTEFNGVRTDVIEVGQLRAMQTVREQWRPAIGGISIGHYQVTAGTLGCVMYDARQNTPVVLSNNHVLANSNKGNLGDPILQQGVVDGGIVGRDTLAILARYIPLKFLSSQGYQPLPDFILRFGLKLSDFLRMPRWREYFEKMRTQVNQVDAALARPLDSSLISNEVYEIGTPSGLQNASLGLAVRKSGRTTGLTTGSIQIVNATVMVSYGDSLTARFENQILTTAMCQGGDSGSILFTTNTPKIVGLLFGGSSFVTIYNPIQTVLTALNITATPT